ncbi:unnamed protein product [Taenia asiatica]|uniref:Uncharacterized protein n=1 Tax=Taenia asiatica TaxID=60517 RepID=A0A0R3VX55_TAEAS|nr:unnamed protein product [Taenia asiatica]
MQLVGLQQRRMQDERQMLAPLRPRRPHDKDKVTQHRGENRRRPCSKRVELSIPSSNDAKKPRNAIRMTSSLPTRNLVLKHCLSTHTTNTVNTGFAFDYLTSETSSSEGSMKRPQTQSLEPFRKMSSLLMENLRLVPVS